MFGDVLSRFGDQIEAKTIKNELNLIFFNFLSSEGTYGGVRVFGFKNKVQILVSHDE